MPTNDAWLDLSRKPYRFHFHAAVTHGVPIIIDADEKTQRLSIRSQADPKVVLISGKYTIDPKPITGPEANTAATAPRIREAPATSHILIPSGQKDAKKEETNRALVLDFWANFFGGHADEWRKWLSPDFVNHDPFEPSGGEAFSKFMLAQAAARRPPAVVGATPTVPTDAAPTAPVAKRSPDRLFLLADGDLVMIVYPGSKKEDLTENVHGNIVRVIDGKITDWWLIGWFPAREGREPRIGDGKKGTQPQTSN
jgi:predicted SnoaL-like aldol condensation-catalyzing enzyme